MGSSDSAGVHESMRRHHELPLYRRRLGGSTSSSSTPRNGRSTRSVNDVWRCRRGKTWLRSATSAQDAPSMVTMRSPLRSGGLALLARGRATMPLETPEVIRRLFGGIAVVPTRRSRPPPKRSAGVPDPAFWLVMEYWRLGDWRHP